MATLRLHLPPPSRLTMSIAPRSARVPPSSAVGYVASPMVCVVVGKGDSTEEYFIHQGLIRPRSGFIDKALQEGWKEGQERKVTLAAEEPAIFAVYLELLYTDNLPVKQNEEKGNDSGEYAVLSKLYVLADMLIDEATKKIVLKAMSAKSNELNHDKQRYFPNLGAIEIIYLRTREDDPARQLLVRLYTDNHLNISDTTSDAVPKDFTFDLAISLMAKRPLLQEHEQCKSQLAAKTKEVSEKDEALKKNTELLKANSKTIKSLQLEKESVEDAKDLLSIEKRSLVCEKISLKTDNSTIRHEKDTLETEKRTMERQLRNERRTKEDFSSQLAGKAQDLEEIKSYMRKR